MKKHSSRPDNKNKPTEREPGKVSAIPLNRDRDRGVQQSSDSGRGNRLNSGERKAGGTRSKSNEQLQQDELQKDLELLARLREQIEQLPEIDAARIVQLHERIVRGEYRINSESLASKLSKFESDI